MIGDRYLTDVVYGNRNGMFTVRLKAFDLNGEPTSVLWVSTSLIIIGYFHKSCSLRHAIDREA